MVLAVIKTGGKQYLVTAGTILDIEKLPGEQGAKLEFDEVLLVDNGETAQVGTPILEKAKVTAEIVDQVRDPKITVFKMKRRKRYRRTLGHKQFKTRVKIVGIVAG